MRTRLVTRAAQAGGAGQQRADLGGVAGVVEEDQDAAAVEGGAVERGPFGRGVGDGGVGGAERAQEGAEDGFRFCGAGVGALEVDVELAVGEVRAGGVGHVHGEGGLADAADAGERGDGHDLVLGAAGEDRAELVYEAGAAGEVGYGRGQLGGPHVSGGGCRGGVFGAGQVGVGVQDALLERGQFGARVDAEFVGEEPAGVGVDGECLGLPAAAVEGEHEQLAQPFAQGMGGGEGGELGHGLGVVADLQVEVEAGLQQRQAPFGEPGALGLGVRAGDPGEGLALPQVQGAGQERAGEGAVPGGAGAVGVGGEAAGDAEVEGGGGAQPDGVAAGLGDEQAGGDDLAQAGGVGADGGQGLLRGVLAPDGVDEFGCGGGAAVAQQEYGEQGALLGVPEGRASPPRQARTGPRTANRDSPAAGSAGAGVPSTAVWCWPDVAVVPGGPAVGGAPAGPDSAPARASGRGGVAFWSAVRAGVVGGGTGPAGRAAGRLRTRRQPHGPRGVSAGAGWPVRRPSVVPLPSVGVRVSLPCLARTRQPVHDRSQTN